MRPPPIALSRASTAQSDSLPGLLALANRTCRLVADIERLGRVRPQTAPSRSSTASTALDPAICDFLCPRASLSPLPKRTSPSWSASQPCRPNFVQYSARALLQGTASPSRSQSRSVSSAAAPASNDVSNTDRQADPPYDFLSTSDVPWQPTQNAAQSSVRPPSSFVHRPAHWSRSWKARTSHRHKEDSNPCKHFGEAFEEHQREFQQGWDSRSEHNGITLRRLQADRLWRLYCQHAHQEALPLHIRLQVATELTLAAHRVTTNKTESPSSKALRCLFGRRLSAILQDCDVHLAAKRKRSSSSVSGLLKHHNLHIALLKPISLALQSKPIAALRSLDDVLLRCRPDIYMYREDAGREADRLSSINLALITIIDSINFDIDCQGDADMVAQSIRSHTTLFQDVEMLADLKDGLVNLRESEHPIQESVKWMIDSPHAFLLSQPSFPSFRSARIAFLHCLSKARDPHDIIDTLASHHDPEDPAFVQACDVLLRSAILNKGSEAALDLYDDLWSRGVPVSSALIRKLIRNASGQASSARLEVLLHRNSPKAAASRALSSKLLRAIALAWAVRNRPDRVDAILRELRRRKDRKYDSIVREVSLQLHAVRGDLKAIHDNLAQIYDFDARSSEDCAAGKQPLNAKAFSLLLKACNRADDIDLAEHYLMQALERGVAVRSSDFNLLIDLHVRKTNIDAALAIFEQMKQFGVSPDKYTFTTLIHGFTLRRDPESAAHTLRAMLAAGKVPDRVTYAALINCYVESGLYDAAIRLFAWLQQQQDVRLRPTIEICNIMLKAYVLSSLPIQKVMQFVNSITKKGLRPNANTYALMLQSASDAGLMHVAEEIFSEAERALPDLTGIGPGQGANLYHFTIMIHGYLRLGDQKEAKEYFDEMRNRKLQPSAITWAVMVKSYAESENETNYDLACTLVSQLVADESKKIFKPALWSVPTSNEMVASDNLTAGGYFATRQSPPFETLFSALMVAQARRGEPEKVEKALQQLSRTTPSLSVYAMTPLLDAYRRVGDVDSALQLYERIYESALGAVRSKSDRVYAYSLAGQGETQPTWPQQRRQDASSRNLLCLPVSIMIDLLSTASRHQEIAEIWSRAKKDGFGFDSDNWNHLAASMARAGQLEEALLVVEHVLHHNPPSSWMRYRSGADLRKGSDDEAPVEEDEDALTRQEAVVEDADDATQNADEVSQQAEDFDPLPADANLDPATTHRPDAASPPSHPPNRRHEARTDDDPYVDLPFEVAESSEDIDSAEGDELDGSSRIFSAHDKTEDSPPGEPSAFYLDDGSELDASLTRNLNSSASFSPWYAHFETMEAISRGLAQIREASNVIVLLDKYSTAARLLDLHERKVDIMRQRQADEAIRSARDLIDVKA